MTLETKHYQLDGPNVQGWVPYQVARSYQSYPERCINPRHRVAPSAVAKLWFCPGCEDYFRKDLRDIASLLPQLSTTIGSPESSASEVAGRSNAIDPPLPVDTTQWDLRTDVYAWAEILMAQIFADRPAARCPTSPVEFIGWLARWEADYYLGHPSSDLAMSTMEEARTARNRLVRALPDQSSYPAQHLSLECRRLIMAKGKVLGTCGGSMSVILDGDTPSVIRCSLDPQHVIRREDWVDILRDRYRKPQ